MEEGRWIICLKETDGEKSEVVRMKTGFVLPGMDTHSHTGAMVRVGVFGVDASAQNRLVSLARKTGKPFVLRVGVLGGGCSGYQYEIVEGTPEDGDTSASFGEEVQAQVVVDAISMPFLDGAVLRAESDMLGHRFVVDNPNAVSGCGCGVSFAM